MRPDNFKWVQIGPYCSLSVLMNPHGSICVFRRPYGSKWVIIGPYLSLRILMCL